MKPIQLYAAGVVLAVFPAVVGLAGNASFSQSVPVRSPEVDSRTAPARPTPTASPTHDANDDDGRRQGGRGADDDPTPEADDDGRRHRGRGADDGPTPDADDDRGGDSGSRRSGGDDRRHGSDDDGGSGGHGSDD